MTVNTAILVGNLGADPEIKTLNSGARVCNIGLATSESWKDKNTGERQEKTTWHDLVFWNQQADIVVQYCKKGSKLYVEGSIDKRKSEQGGNFTDIKVRNFQFLDSKGSSSGDSAPSQEAAFNEADIPF
jgi:single-strand DNA-binding protein